MKVVDNSSPVELAKPAASTLDQFVVKIASRCNIACKYCYMYELGDRSALENPKFISNEVVRALAGRLLEHANLTNLDQVIVALHGGEPLLVGIDRFRFIVDTLREALGPRLSLRIQTNGTLIDSSWIDALAWSGAVVGVSLDGPRDVNDRYRVDHRKLGTFDRASRGLWALQNAKESKGLVLGGIISVIDPTQSPSEYWHWINEIEAEFVGLLFPDADRDNYFEYYTHSIDAYSTYLCELFDLWWTSSDSTIDIRLFRNLVKKCIGGSSDSESIGSPGAPAVIIDADGTIQAHDVLRINAGQPKFHLNVLSDPVSSILDDESFISLNQSLFFGKDFRLPSECKSCPVRDLCGGGFVIHRYSKDRGYDNPSVYCDALFELASHVYIKVACDD